MNSDLNFGQPHHRTIAFIGSCLLDTAIFHLRTVCVCVRANICLFLVCFLLQAIWRLVFYSCWNNVLKLIKLTEEVNKNAVHVPSISNIEDEKKMMKSVLINNCGILI